MIDDLPVGKRIVGTKQVIKAAESGIPIRCVYVAEDADENVKNRILTACGQNRVDVEVTSCMELLGKACGIDVGAACVALVEESTVS